MENNENLNIVELSDDELEQASGGKGGKKYVQATGNVHVRKYPDKESADLGILDVGDKVPYLDQWCTDDREVVWYKVKYGGGHGWVSSKYSKVVG